MSSGRSPYSTGACMGLPVYWRVSDLPPSYDNVVVVLNAVTANTTSATFTPGARGLQVMLLFSDGATSCSISLLVNSGSGFTQFGATRNGLNSLKQEIYFGALDDNLSIDGNPIQIELSNYTGTGTVTVSITRLN